MSLNLNLVTLAGHLTHDPELRTTSSGLSVTTFTIAVNRRYSRGDEKQTDFIDCIAWRDRADFISKYFSKGAAICVTGTIQTRTYEDKNGNKRKATEVIVDNADFVESKSSSQQNAQYYPTAAPAPAASVPQQMTMADAVEDDDLPF